MTKKEDKKTRGNYIQGESKRKKKDNQEREVAPLPTHPSKVQIYALSRPVAVCMK